MIYLTNDAMDQAVYFDLFDKNVNRCGTLTQHRRTTLTHLMVSGS